MANPEIDGVRVPEDSVDLITSVLDMFEARDAADISREQLITTIAGHVSTIKSAAITPVVHEATGSIFSDSPNKDHRIIRDYDKLQTVVEGLRVIGTKIVLTSGSFDMLHVGHTSYLEKARQFGDLLVVGVDSDEKLRERKGPNRPVIPEDERLQMLTHIRGVGLITLKGYNDEKWQLIKTVRPDVLIATEGTYRSEEKEELESEHCGQVVVLPPQATTSTSAKIRKIQVEGADELSKRILTTIESYLKGEPA